MANLKFNRYEFEKEVKITKEIEEKINLFGTPIQNIDEKGVEIEISPNRPDLLSFQGFLRGFKAFIGKETGLKKYKINKPEKDCKVEIDSSVKKVRPFTTCAIVKNLSLDDKKIKDIIEMQEKLHSTLGRNRKKIAIGIYPLEKINLPIKYKAIEPEKIKFIPLESEKEMNGFEILQRHPAGKEYGSLIEDYEKFPIFIDSNNKILSMPPIINSNETGKITEQTKDVFIECSGWNFEILKKTLNIVVTSLAEIGGKIYAMELNYNEGKKITPDLNPEKIKISLENVNKLLGLNLKEKDLEKLLPRMNYDYKNKVVYVPAWRIDILHEVDIIEDIAIAYGYNNFSPEVPNISTIGEESKESRLKDKISNILIGLGLIETSSYHLVKEREANIMQLKNKIEIESSKTDYKILRPNLLIPILRILSENKDHDYPQKIFEIGAVFSLDKENVNETGINENENLIVASSPANFTDVKQILDYLMEQLNIKYEIEESHHQNLIDGRTGKIILNKKEIGYIGELHPETLRAWNIKMPVSVIEISLEEIFLSIK